MSEDDLGRQLSELIRASADVEVPSSLLASVADIPRQAPRRRANRGLLGATAAIGAAVVLAAAALIGPRFWSNPPAATLVTGPIPATKVQVLTPNQLRAAIAAQRAGGLQPQDVVADVSIDTSRKTAPLSRECDPYGQCQVIGTLQGFDDAAGAVAIAQEGRVLPPATDAVALQAPVALRLTGTGPVEFLGHVRFAPSGSPTWSVSEALADTTTAADEQVVGIDGWLEGATGFSCGPPPQSPFPPPPFACGLRDYITPDARLLVVTTDGGNGHTYSAPSDGIPVQMGAYGTYALNPSYGTDQNDEPRRAIYLLRMVAFDASSCVGCRSWLVVGRLDASAATSSTEAGPVVRSPAELEQLLSADRSQWVGRAFYVDGVVTPGTPGGCGSSNPCQIGTLDGTSEKVVASPYTVSMLPSEADFMTTGVLAVTVRQDGLEYLGYAGYKTDNSFYFTPAQLTDPQWSNHAPLMTVVVKAWLVDGGLHSCAPPQPGSPDLSDTPFETCPEAWLAPSAYQPVSTTDGGGVTITAPSGALRIQPEAYQEFAPNPSPDPSLEPNGIAHVPRYGTFLLRLVQNPPSGSSYQSGWQMVARLDP
jgi:hypothetical protein